MKKEKPEAQPRPSPPQLPPDAGFDEITEFILNRRQQPIELASAKLLDFVNQCVSDRDFRHPQSDALLHFLLIVRDILCDGINENWTLSDIFIPLEERIKHVENEKRMRGLNDASARRSAAKSWAQERARCHWGSDTQQKIRITEMVELVWREMAITEHVDVRPETIKAFKEWIKEVAPEHASKRGRIRKN